MEVQNSTLRDALYKYRLHVGAHSIPPDCWHSNTLNFGDILLFDYQVEHRGGHNASPDLRSLLYLTYSRYWYNDVNFNSEFVDSIQDGDGNILNQLLSTTRFAIPNHRDTSGKVSNTTPLQDIKQILLNQRLNEAIPSVGGEKFIVSNKDVINPEILHVFVGERNFGHLQPGGSVAVGGRPGDLVQVRSADGQVIQSWSVVEEQGQMIMSKRFLHK